MYLQPWVVSVKITRDTHNWPQLFGEMIKLKTQHGLAEIVISKNPNRKELN